MAINPETHTNFPVPIRKTQLAELREVAGRFNVSMALVIRAGIRLAIARLLKGGPRDWLAE